MDGKMMKHTSESKEEAMEMNVSKRNFLRLSSVLGLAALTGLYKSADAFAAEWKEAEFTAENLKSAMKSIGAENYTMSGDVVVDSAEIAENGAVVPVRVKSAIPNTEYMAVLVEKNPNPLATAFNIPEGTAANVKTRIKMGETSNVFAVVKADGKWFAASKEIKVTLGGCGG